VGNGVLWDLADAMTSSSESERILEMAAAGIPRVAQAIAAISVEDRIKALEAAERSYCQTALDIAYGEAQAEGWAAALMFQLRAELEKQKVGEEGGWRLHSQIYGTTEPLVVILKLSRLEIGQCDKPIILGPYYTLLMLESPFVVRGFSVLSRSCSMCCRNSFSNFSNASKRFCIRVRIAGFVWERPNGSVWRQAAAEISSAMLTRRTFGLCTRRRLTRRQQ